MDASIPDLLRLVAVPALGWAAIRDIRTRRITSNLWPPLFLLGAMLILWEGLISLGTPGAFQLFLVRVTLSVLLLFSLSLLFRYIGEFGGADVKALMMLAILFPAYPYYAVSGDVYPAVRTTLGVFSLTILTNAVLLGLVYPVALGIQNSLTGNFSVVMFVGRRVAVKDLPEVYGRLLERKSGFSRQELDLDALRMYLRWRGLEIEDLLENPDLRDPDTLPEEPHEPTDGVVKTDGSGDPWGAAAFLEDIEGSAYGTTPEKLRQGLDLITTRDEVWVTPGTPFLVFVFLGLVVGLTGGDVLFYIMQVLGLVPA